MALRSIRERALQTLCYEAGAFLIATPLYGLIAGHNASQSSLMVIAVAIACMIWAPLHHFAWDWLEWRLARRVASDRPQSLRMIHAVSHEVSSIVVTTPIIMLVGGHSFGHALLVDVGFTLLYSFYAYFFHVTYDWLRPVQAEVVTEADCIAPVLALMEEPARQPSRSKPQARRPARWAPQILPHAALAQITSRRDDSHVNGF